VQPGGQPRARSGGGSTSNAWGVRFRRRLDGHGDGTVRIVPYSMQNLGDF